MLTIYTNNPIENCILSNDKEFDTNTIDVIEKDITGNLKNKIEEIEEVKFQGNKIISKINGEPISLTDISTGCKTIINIMVNPEKIIFAMECGNNYAKYIYTLKEGKIYAPSFLLPYNMDEIKSIDIVLFDKNNEAINFTDIYKLERWYYDNAEY